MPTFRILSTLLVASLPLLGAARADDKPKATVEKNVTYATVGDRELKLDIARPAGDGPFPAVVCIHGGGWRGGAREVFLPLIGELAKRSYVAVTITYRLAPKDPFPAQVEDSKAAVRWLRANAAKYKIDPDRIGATGMSAGGHLASMLGLVGKDAGLEGDGGNKDQSSRVQAVVNWFGPTDFTRRTWTKRLEEGVLIPFLGGTLKDKEDVYKKASPVSYVAKTAPPFLFFHGDKDALVSVEQSKLLAAKLKDAGASARVVVLEGAGHGWGGEQLVKTVNEMYAFFDEHLKKK